MYVFFHWCKNICVERTILFSEFIYICIQFLLVFSFSEPQSSRRITALWFHQNWTQLYICILAAWEEGSHVYNKYRALWFFFFFFVPENRADCMNYFDNFFIKILLETKMRPCFKAKSAMREHRFPIQNEKTK